MAVPGSSACQEPSRTLLNGACFGQASYPPTKYADCCGGGRRPSVVTAAAAAAAAFFCCY